MADTRVDLVAELEHLLAHAKPGATKRQMVEEIIRRARAGDFHDFKSELAAPKVALVDALRAASLSTIARRVIGGEFDETPDEHDKAQLQAKLTSSQQPVPPMVVPAERNLDERRDVFLSSDGIDVYSWGPGRADENLPSTQVHLCLPTRFEIEGKRLIVTLRLKSPRALDELVATLLQHRKDVWPSEGGKPG